MGNMVVDVSSTVLSIVPGVPQGSVIGLFLFNINLNDIIN